MRNTLKIIFFLRHLTSPVIGSSLFAPSSLRRVVRSASVGCVLYVANIVAVPVVTGRERFGGTQTFSGHWQPCAPPWQPRALSFVNALVKSVVDDVWRVVYVDVVVLTCTFTCAVNQSML